ncbi:NlpC/P60 family protein [Vagococcus sp. PNs007]|uniref:Peptidoglycan hydrolase n=1 Tax=Vagococcus proximus TaxID=2991417 RepID=A0ABT5X480_9ENTE|nr:glucosaminidase domain-containing protein [Vagococcus proximus]MDF0480739.1 NlpC/P60 family protein [Vagococcus proximus]
MKRTTLIFATMLMLVSNLVTPAIGLADVITSSDSSVTATTEVSDNPTEESLPLGSGSTENSGGEIEVPTPPTGETELPGTGTTEAPETGTTEDPGISETETTEPPITEPETSETQKPETSETEKPETSETQKPETSETEKPETSETQKPETSETEKPETSKPEKPNKPKPEKPNKPKPEKPNKPKPEKPNKPKPEKPTKPKPEKPKPGGNVSPKPSRPNGNVGGSGGEIHITTNQTSQEFIDTIGPLAAEIGEKQGLYASVMIAQAALESAYGKSGLASPPNHNLFGIKGSYKNSSVSFATLEDSGAGNMYQIVAGFRSYPSYKESLEDYADLIKNGIAGNSSFYAGTWKKNAKTYKEATSFLTGRYATDTSYDQKLNGIIKAYDLTKYDNGTESSEFETIETTVKMPAKFYRVQNNDSLQKISTKQKVELDKIFDLNEEIENPNMIYPGQKIKVAKEKEIKKIIKRKKTSNRRMLKDPNKVIELARTYIGVPYVWGGTTPQGFDCSGLVQYVYNKLGVSLPRVTYDQEYAGKIIPFEQLEPGDLLFWGQRGSTWHVAFYSGEGNMIMAPQPGEFVKELPMNQFMPDFAIKIKQNRLSPD